MNSPMTAFFGSVIAVILLCLFSFSVFYMISTVVENCRDLPVCAPASPLFGDGFKYVVTTVGGLVSALVIAHLTVAEPGNAPTIGSFAPESKTAVYATNTVVVLYLLAWIATGLAALVVGVMLFPNASSTLSDIGSTWLGLAVSAAYAYFGIRSQADRQEDASSRMFKTGDLTQGQKVPNVSEVDTCGAIQKKIKRTDPEFAGLVSNSNAKIVFKDEEGTGADRVMAPRLKSKLDSLANVVASEWPGTKLPVTEAWVNEHADGSLHYEGRAADLTTDPVDGTRLGRLARLAVDAGCDWVFFEDSAHIHVSMKVA
ncbi:hypothetical protein NKJ74_26880 [Mesorhizobium sp. M0046]|uniref:hypothetical protein n=1 Tax=Mesorhizobium sp. M0046 TaxID=2956858 RepID=UPI003338B531